MTLVRSAKTQGSASGGRDTRRHSGKWSGSRVSLLVFYTTVAVVLTAATAEQLYRVLPDSAAEHAGQNTEGYVIALVLCVWMQFAKPRLAESSAKWPLAVLAIATCAAVGLALYNSDEGALPSQVKLLNEAGFACALAIPYMQFPRPLPKPVPVTLMFLLLAAVPVFGHSYDLVAEQAETLILLVLVAASFDLIGGGILEPGQGNPFRKRYGWYVFLVAFPTSCIIAQNVGVGRGGLDDITHYISRATEAFVAVLLLEVHYLIRSGAWATKRRS